MRAGWWGAVPPTDRAPEDPRPVTSDRALRLIALFKFGKAALLVLIAAGALGLVRPAMAARRASNHRAGCQRQPSPAARGLDPSPRPAATPTRGIRRWRISLCRSVSRRRGRPLARSALGRVSDSDRYGVVGAPGIVGAEPSVNDCTCTRPSAEPLDRCLLDWSVAPKASEDPGDRRLSRACSRRAGVGASLRSATARPERAVERRFVRAGA